MNFSFQECYTILGIAEASDWKSLRTKYKTLIQQHHPDRYPESTPEHTQAENKIRQYNLAYKIIFDYYKKNACLPPNSRTKHEKIIRATPPRKKRPTVSQNKSSFKTPSRKKTFNTSKLVFVLSTIGFLIILIIQSFFDDTQADIPQQTNFSIENKKPLETTTKPIALINPSFNQSNESQQYFSLGSGLGEVILIQGKPSRTEGNIWYYGESTITFSNGVVVTWYRHPAHPLKAKLNESLPKTQSNTENQTNKAIQNKPYWSR